MRWLIAAPLLQALRRLVCRIPPYTPPLMFVS